MLDVPSIPPPLTDPVSERSVVSEGRRRLLRWSVTSGVVGAAALRAPGAAAALPTAPHGGAAERRSLRLVNSHTWEKLDIVYFTHGVYIDESLEEISHLMRDHRENLIHPIDRSLIDDLVRMHASLGTKEPLHVLSGYRSPATNAKLRKRSSGVAKFSLHMEGRAADIYVPGISTNALRKAAIAMNSGGVGYYRKSGFVHIDTGRVRRWKG